MSQIIKSIRDAVIGQGQCFATPFGEKPLVYADYTASGRGLSFIEDYIRDQVLPWYANTHTETSFTGAQTTSLREQARGQIRSALNGTDADKVIFCGSGATAAIDRLIDILNLRLPNDIDRRYGFDAQIPQRNRPVVFIGPYEHHSNELPWRESIAEVVTIPLTSQGKIDVDVLEAALIKYRTRPLKIGSFSAGSNVTGIKSDVHGITGMLKAYGALAFWDYAAASPYVGIDMNGEHPLDAVFVSPHKFIGGPGTPGVLVIKDHVLTNSVPAVVGGGTVMYVTPQDHRFTSDIERREEGGTPAIIESIRAGLVFKLQQSVTTDVIERLEGSFIQRAMARMSKCEQVEILGGTDVARLSIMSLRFKHGDKDLHYGFVVSLLNDLFGIQTRGGCSCAGPYGHSLLGMDIGYSKAIEAQLARGHMVLRPGWVRLNFNYFISEAEFDYLLSALELVSEHGWRLLPYYQFDEAASVWRYAGREQVLPSSIDELDMAALASGAVARQESTVIDYAALLREARDTLLQERGLQETYELSLPAEVNALRWFVLPQEVAIEPTAAIAV